MRQKQSTMKYRNLIPLRNENNLVTMMPIKNTIKYDITVITLANIGVLLIMLLI